MENNYIYDGFTEEALELMFQIRINASKEFYEEKKPRYREIILKPMQQIVSALTPTMLEADANMLVTPSIGKTISKMRRDTRFSKDKTPYRDTIWCYFRRTGRGWLYSPGFYFEITPVSFSYGVGIAGSTPAVLSIYRDKIREDIPAFRKTIQCLEQVPDLSLEGELYKKDFGDSIPEDLYHLYNRRYIYTNRNSSDMSLLAKKDFPDQIIRDFKILTPFYKFLNSVWEEFALRELKKR